MWLWCLDVAVTHLYHVISFTHAGACQDEQRYGSREVDSDADPETRRGQKTLDLGVPVR